MLSQYSSNLKIFLKTLTYILLTILLVAFAFLPTNLVEFGAIFGRLAIYIFWLITVPGILLRFKVKGFLKNIQIILMSNRRALGILMFVLVLIHYWFSRGFANIKFGIPTIIPVYQIIGFTAFWLLIPLVITSNDFSKRKMKKWWQILHYLSYPIMVLLIFHTALQPSNTEIFDGNFNLSNTIQYAIPTVIILIVQASSWVYFFQTKAGKKAE
jgi:DMSO/TMAO reductase YedYZ heme-binding membrane subunit